MLRAALLTALSIGFTTLVASPASAMIDAQVIIKPRIVVGGEPEVRERVVVVERDRPVVRERVIVVEKHRKHKHKHWHGRRLVEQCDWHPGPYDHGHPERHHHDDQVVVIRR